jgi:hypothetical protein
MSKQTKAEPEEQLNSQESANEKPSNYDSTLIKHIPIKDTPFTVVIKENNWFATFKNYRITEPKELDFQLNTDEADEQLADIALIEIENKRWLVIMYMTAIIHETIAEEAIEKIRQEQQ